MKKEIQHTIKNGESIILEYSTKGNLLHGVCNWYSANQVLISSGKFKEGKPFTGSFLNWSKVIDNIFGENDYEVDVYCRDWITFYESGLDSRLPNYTGFLEFYERGNKIE